MNLTYLTFLFSRLPNVLPALAAQKSLTFLVPSLAAFAGSGIDLGNITAEHLAAHVDYAVLAEGDTGFIGYTPSLRDGEGQTYLTRQGGRVLITKRGGEVWVGDARVVRRDCVVGNGVVHIIDKVRTYVVGVVGRGKGFFPQGWSGVEWGTAMRMHGELLTCVVTFVDFGATGE